MYHLVESAPIGCFLFESVTKVELSQSLELDDRDEQIEG
jgi:hypothetical protein